MPTTKMPRAKAKLCGLTTAETVTCALANGADYLGFMTFPKSPRHLSPVDARPLARMATGLARTVSVLVNPDDDLIDAVLCDLLPDFIQLHGQETPERCAQIRGRGVGVIKAFGISSSEDLSQTKAYLDATDMLLFDAKPPKDATRPGGLGEPFDWRLLADFRSALPWFLSGGLTAANVAQAIGISGAAYVDVSSGIESAPGLKDTALIQAFMAALNE